ncbi:MAG: hypothetical protein MUO23_06985 [Anaerolineales bacterium]|nr:hypothetical protein [Anaerolineales bacterium]
MLELASLAALRTDEGLACQAEAMRLRPTPITFLLLSQKLSRVYPERLGRLALEQAMLRQRAAAKFKHAERMYFTRQGLEQATPGAVAEHRARRYQAVERVFDLCCGIGGDALALAEHRSVFAVDHDLLSVALLEANARAVGRDGWIRPVVGDVTCLPWRFGVGDAAFFDPARREATRRIRQPERYLPPLSTLRIWVDHLAGLGVKVSPAIDRDELAGYECEVEFVSLEGDLKEATLWFGALKTSPVRATVLPGGHTLAEPPLRLGRVSPPQAYLYEPDPAVMRAGLVGNLAERLGAAQLDPTLAYLTCSSLQPTPFARAFQVIDHMPFSRKRLQAALKALGAGEVVLMKRGSPVDTEALSRRLRLSGDRSLTVVLTRVSGTPTALIVLPVAAFQPLGD